MLVGSSVYNKLCSVNPFTFDVVELCVVIMNDKSWTRAKVLKSGHVLKSEKQKYNNKIPDITKVSRCRENHAQNNQLNRLPTAGYPVNWPKDSQRKNIYINEEKKVFK